MANTHAETATIYQFPIITRKVRRDLGGDATVVLLDRKLNRFSEGAYADAAYGGSWYHDAAIEAEHKPKS
ncbi:MULTISPECIES: DUF2735 domain-containing protein [Rhizobium]|uniref:DUF2735 domain-containing protein n=1 Tax=Rhizobium rhododendri TaxID=2506430 RepID=A0ABY8IS35_9HYPH|nr:MULTISPECIES: DUF2735 domain-containing protein [Rhizobium]MBZ5759514.1 DUF2735 domain-containing protein [Rhizobium sp. VS19-DR96]MBZ5765753.1 DUF2735 domain-containing protein [Rhizobium sp. VS19-DR129.2]MBZ5773837.1 DUF2735 domain-containing protein [Rhizobium sp. VS19-DRK62.2]MBZ5784909.1 DUF2735 domain-containing protein [Rhizobium sp. VS19-DR121]MBZ5802014.1 DUF2735 domain-containing protein [Rhizobium sp. VS19-DR181]